MRGDPLVNTSREWPSDVCWYVCWCGKSSDACFGAIMHTVRDAQHYCCVLNPTWAGSAGVDPLLRHNIKVVARKSVLVAAPFPARKGGRKKTATRHACVCDHRSSLGHRVQRDDDPSLGSESRNHHPSLGSESPTSHGTAWLSQDEHYHGR